MKICLNFTGRELAESKRFNFDIGCLSYIADGANLYTEKLVSPPEGDVMIVFIKHADPHIAAPIYDECRKRKFRSVFLDSETESDSLTEICDSLSRRGLCVFCPIEIAHLCQGARPVAEGAVSGGSLSEYLEALRAHHENLSLSLSRNALRFDMGAEGFPLSQKELRQLISIHDAKIFYSPTMMINYFIFSPSPKMASYVLFDDARSLSEKIRLAKKLGVSNLFLTYSEIADIASAISF